MEIKTTQRGFSIADFTDINNVPCSIQKSSLATQDAIWLGITNIEPTIMVSDAKRLGISTTENNGWCPYPIPEEVLLSSRMHLSREQVAELLPILENFVQTGELY